MGSPEKTKSPSLALLSCDLLCSARLFWAKIRLKSQSLLQQHQSCSGYLSETLGAGFAASAGQRLRLGVVALLLMAWPLPGNCLPRVGLEQKPSHHPLLMVPAALSHPSAISLRGTGRLELLTSSSVPQITCQLPKTEQYCRPASPVCQSSLVCLNLLDPSRNP